MIRVEELPRDRVVGVRSHEQRLERDELVERDLAVSARVGDAEAAKLSAMQGSLACAQDRILVAADLVKVALGHERLDEAVLVQVALAIRPRLGDRVEGALPLAHLGLAGRPERRGHGSADGLEPRLGCIANGVRARAGGRLGCVGGFDDRRAQRIIRCSWSDELSRALDATGLLLAACRSRQKPRRDVPSAPIPVGPRHRAAACSAGVAAARYVRRHARKNSPHCLDVELHSASRATQFVARSQGRSDASARALR